MPHVNGSSDGDDLGDADEIKVFKHDEECEEEKKLIAEERQSDSLTEDKSSLVTEGESQSKNASLAGQSFTGKNSLRPEPGPLFGGRSLESLASSHASPLNMGYLMPYSYHNGMAALTSLPSMGNKMGHLGSAAHHAAAAAAAASSLQFFYQGGGDPHLGQPPPAHMGIPPYQLDPKTAGAMGLPRPSMYSFAPTQYPYPMLSPEMAQMTSWHHNGGMYPISSAAAAFRSPYPAGLQLPSASLPRFSPSLLPHPGLHGGHPLMSPGHAAALSSLHHGVKQEPGLSMGLLGEQNHRSGHNDAKAASSSATQSDSRSTTQSTPPNNNNTSSQVPEKKKPHIKKPLNAFMLYMKEMRAKVVAECTLKESAAINQILGRRWHTLSREEQSRYYEMARQQRQLHMQLYPNWTMRDSVASGAARKRRNKRDKAADGGNNMKKCRARYGLDQQSQWCKPCRRKKKCIRYMDGADEADHSEDNLGSAGSVGETRSPDSKVDDDDGASSDSDAGAPDDDDGGATSASDLGLSSPGLSLSSLASPAILPSPSTSLASPCPLTPSPATPSSASYTTSGGVGGHDAIINIIGKSSLITAQTSLSAASSSSSSSSSSGNGSTPGLPFGLYNMLPGPSPSGSGHSHHSVHHHHHSHHHPLHPAPSAAGQQHHNSSHHSHHHQHLQQQQQQQQHNHHGLLLPANLPHRHPIGTNPHDINNPLSVNQLTGQCSSNSNKDKAHSSVSKASDTNSHAIVSVT
ncbi:protein pangolin, isoforms A/H/I/S isoform X1 [Daphnia magna]|uniref:protein pangolin, isoforms A/H/I/S isoform X1 n=1 Tax=Daphnia magna TaxID=35525 RepID=UPI001E1BBF72|nr:protein pangolin, isoforms A/H/I/S isoform X1 [Daphnia magna]